MLLRDKRVHSPHGHRLALVAGFLFALGLVLRELAASAQPASRSAAGSSCDSYTSQCGCSASRRRVRLRGPGLGVGIGRMVIVQPLLVSTIVFALPIARI
jgi:hypothetical protein